MVFSGKLSSAAYWLAFLSRAFSASDNWVLLSAVLWLTGDAYELGLSGLWIFAVPWILAQCCKLLLVLLVKQPVGISCFRAIEERFGRSAGVFSAFVRVAYRAMISGAELYAASLLLAPALGVPNAWLIYICAFILMAYYLSAKKRPAVLGLSAERFSALVYMVLVVLAAVSVKAHEIAAAQNAAIWGLLRAQQILNTGGYPVDPQRNPASPFAYETPLFPMVLLLALVPGWIADDDDFWSVFRLARSRKESCYAIVSKALVYTLLVICPASLIGLLGLIVFPPECRDGVLVTPERLGDIGGYGVFAACIGAYLIPWLKALILFLVTFLVLTALLNSCGVAARFLSAHLRDEKSKDSCWSEQLNALFVALAVVALAAGYSSARAGFCEIYIFASSLMTSGMAVMFFAGFWKHASPTGALLSGIFGVVGVLVSSLPEAKAVLFHGIPFGYCVAGIFFSVAGLILGNCLDALSTLLKYFS